MRKRTRVFLALGALLLLGADQGLLYLGLDDGYLMGRRIAPFDPPLFFGAHERRLRDIQKILAGDPDAERPKLFDPLVGWCPRPGARLPQYKHDETSARIGSKPSKRGRSAGVERVVALGCSFTRGDEVRGQEAWAAVISDADPALEVLNLGMGGFGLDQALLRLERDALPLDPDAIWLVMVPGTLLRATTQYPPLIRHWSTTVAFKPRFILDEAGGLELVPTPVQALEDFVRLMTDQEAFLDALAETDLWVRRAPAAYAPEGSHWTHWFATTRIALTLHERAERDPAPWVADAGGEVPRLSRALILRSAELTRAADKEFRLIVLPSQEDLRSIEARGDRYWSGLVAGVADAGVEVLEATEMLQAEGATHGAEYWMPGGHYSPLTNRLVADWLAAE